LVTNPAFNGSQIIPVDINLMVMADDFVTGAFEIIHQQPIALPRQVIRAMPRSFHLYLPEANPVMTFSFSCSLNRCP
jgi:hypothetical protein